MCMRKTIDDLSLTDADKEMVLEHIADVMYAILCESGVDHYETKSYDPLEIEGKIAHSYVFDFEDGGRHHPFRDYKHLEEMLIAEGAKRIKEATMNDVDYYTGHGITDPTKPQIVKTTSLATFEGTIYTWGYADSKANATFDEAQELIESIKCNVDTLTRIENDVITKYTITNIWLQEAGVLRGAIWAKGVEVKE